jgi:1-acyl-sn-glycerol-3-phosphate acyltransferase
MDIFKSVIVWLTGICFLVILFPVTFIIWLLVLPFDRERAVTHWMLTFQCLFFVRLIPIWKVHIEGREKAVKGTTYVIISNHQSIFDILLLDCLRYKFKWISKIENTKIPVLGWYLRMADYITIDRGNEESKIEMLEKSYNCLKRGISIMIFPEGTRSKTNEIGFFKRGAFQLALDANVPILPVLIDGSGGVLPKHGLIFGCGHHVRIKVLDPVDPASFNTNNPNDLALDFSKLMVSELNKMRSNTVI